MMGSYRPVTPSAQGYTDVGVGPLIGTLWEAMVVGLDWEYADGMGRTTEQQMDETVLAHGMMLKRTPLLLMQSCGQPDGFD